jgi:hypothetical protein
MAKKSSGKEKKPAVEQAPPNAPWIKMKTGVIIIAITSIAMAVLTAWQAIPAIGVTQGILYGLFFGGFIWIIFLGFLLFRRFIH